MSGPPSGAGFFRHFVTLGRPVEERLFARVVLGLVVVVVLLITGAGPPV